MSVLAWVAAGVALGAAFLGFAVAGDAARERRILATGLVVAAAVYVGFALAAASPSRILLELAGVGVFAMPAAGSRGRPLVLAAGWGAHALWDVVLHLGGPIAGVEWYAALCLGFDPLVAGVIAARAMRPGPVAPWRGVRDVWREK